MPRRPFGYSGVSATHSGPSGIPVEIHRLGDERLRGDQLHGEVRMDLQIRQRVRGLLRAALGISQRRDLLRLAELIEVRPLARPRDAAQQDRAIVAAARKSRTDAREC